MSLLCYCFSRVQNEVDRLCLCVCVFFCRIAGVDTSSTTLAYMFWELSRRRDVLARLQAELDDVMPDPCVVPDAATLGRCEYLGAFVKESASTHTASFALCPWQ